MLVDLQAQEAGWPKPEREVRLCKERRFRFDYAWGFRPTTPPFTRECLVALEVDGGVWLRGKSGHSSGKGIMRDMEKGNLAAVHGWTVLRLTPSQVCKGELTMWLRKLAA
jgi:hypothetical protein